MAAPEILILGGTAEAAALARRLAADGRFAPLTSLAGLTRKPAVAARRRGGFGGPAGLTAYLRQTQPLAVVDATHPFAVRMSTHAVTACAATGVPLLRLERPAWKERPGDRWLHVPSLAAAAELVRGFDARVFLSLGAAHLDAFGQDRGRPWFLARTVDRLHRRPFRHGQLVTGRGPFTVLAELGLLRRHRIDLLVTRNSGGPATYAKVAAARRLALPVVMVDRPGRMPAETVAEVAAACGWLDRLVRQ